MTIKRTSFSKSLLEQPQLITPQLFEEVSSYLDGEYSHIYEKLLQEEGREEKSEFADLVQDNIGILNIEGTLVNKKPTGWAAMCMSLTSYEGLTEQAEYIAKCPEVDTVLMNVSSGGGEAFNCFIAAKNIKNILSGKKIIAYVDGMSASAAYALSSIADEIISHPDSETGSIGVVIRLLDQSKALKKEGIKPIFITAGGNKVPFEEDGSFKDSFLEKLKGSVEELYGEFVEHVSTMRNISEDVVRSTNAETYRANKALEFGLIDKIMNYEEFANYLADISEGVKTTENVIPVALSTDDKLELNNEEIEMAVDAEMQAKLDALEAKLAAYEAKEAQTKMEELNTFVANTSFSNKEGIVAVLAEGSEVSKVMSTMITEHMEALASATAESEKLLAEKEEEFNTKLEEAQEEIKSLKAETDQVKEEFSKPAGIEGDNASLEDVAEENKKQTELAAFIKENGARFIQ